MVKVRFKKLKRIRYSRHLYAAGLLLIAAVVVLVPVRQSLAGKLYRGKTREYWIAAVPVSKWNVTPSSKDAATGDPIGKATGGIAPEGDEVAANEEDAAPVSNRPTGATGSSYTALIYRQYTKDWKSPLKDQFGGMPGPLISAHPGDTIVVHFKNLDSAFLWPHSMHPHGVRYTPENDGTFNAAAPQPGGTVPYLRTFTYRWTAGNDSVGSWVYHDHSNNAVTSSAIGLYGVISVTPAGEPAPDVQNVVFFNELLPADSGLPREYDTINGRSYAGNTPTYIARVGQRVRWIVASLGSDSHSFHIHGHRWKQDGGSADVMDLTPAQAKSVTYTEDAPGTWMVHCHVDNHMMNGMNAQYVVRQ